MSNWLIRLAAVDLLLLLLLIGMRVTDRVIVAWWTYVGLRRDPLFQSPEAKQRLWRWTLDAANGKHQRGPQ
jgi:hypothetical protein